jgi:hypothetical protein
VLAKVTATAALTSVPKGSHVARKEIASTTTNKIRPAP